MNIKKITLKEPLTTFLTSSATLYPNNEEEITTNMTQTINHNPNPKMYMEVSNIKFR